jgi:SWI/SNF-related matrix-associated actin-dependent regulator of chromatin subfamily A-like protein 1
MDTMEVKERLNDNNQLIGALIHIYNNQTLEEIAVGATNKKNNIGFSASDAGILTDLTKWYFKNGSMSSKQICLIRRLLPKYWQQLAEGWQSLKINIINPDNKLQQRPQPQKMESYKRVEIFSTDNGDKIQIDFRFPRGDKRFAGTIAEIKSNLSRYQFNKSFFKKWECALCLQNVYLLRKLGYGIGPKLTQWELSRTPSDINPINPPNINSGLTPMPFQKLGIGWVESCKGRALIGDQPGLGKTIQAIGYLAMHPELRPAVIICPAFLKRNWIKEIKKWISPDILRYVQLIEGFPDEEKGHLSNDIIVLNYDVLSNRYAKDEDGKKYTDEVIKYGWIDYLVPIKPKILIADEIHYIAYDTSFRTKAFKQLCAASDNVIGLSGTPTKKRPIQLFNVINSINPHIFASSWDYKIRYCNGRHNGFGWDFNGVSNSEELHNIINKYVMIRRKKEEVIKDLPAKQQSIVLLDLSNRREYDFAEEDFIQWIYTKYNPDEADVKARKAQRAEALVKMANLKQICAQGKLKGIINWIENFIEQEKLVVFIKHTKTADAIQKAFKKQCVRVTGGVSNKKKDENVVKFQTDENCRLFIGSEAAKEGLTLTAASNVAILELWSNYGDMEQATDRVHRIGQDKSVMIWFLLADNTIEEKIMEGLDTEKVIVNKLLDGEETDTQSLVSEIIKSYKK